MSDKCKLNLRKTDDPRDSHRCYSHIPCEKCEESTQPDTAGLLFKPERDGIGSTPFDF